MICYCYFFFLLILFFQIMLLLKDHIQIQHQFNMLYPLQQVFADQKFLLLENQPPKQSQPHTEPVVKKQSDHNANKQKFQKCQPNIMQICMRNRRVSLKIFDNFDNFSSLCPSKSSQTREISIIFNYRNLISNHINQLSMNNHQFCEFCKILQEVKKKQRSVIYQDDELFAFYDIDKSTARQHILVCPTQHIETALEIKSKEFLCRMKELGIKLLDQLGELNEIGQGKNDLADYRFGFHLRPYNSIDHVHLHCFILPFKSFLKDKIVYGRLLSSVQEVIQRIDGAKLAPRL